MDVQKIDEQQSFCPIIFKLCISVSFLKTQFNFIPGFKYYSQNILETACRINTIFGINDTYENGTRPVSFQNFILQTSEFI